MINALNLRRPGSVTSVNWPPIAAKADGRVKPAVSNEFIGDCPAMVELWRLTQQVAATSATVLIVGETGTGKELIARALHEGSDRSCGPFIRVNCGALSDNLLESELFGHVKGAFTSAHEHRTGRFEAAHGGTIFLDEINSLSYPQQVKLLRVLQEQEFERVGDTKTIRVDCRIIAATNRDLLEEICENRFREDLYYRLNVIPIHLPPLRERVADIEPLVAFFARKYALANRRPIPKIDPAVIATFGTYAWPGNIRELQNYIERAVILMKSDVISVDLLPPQVRGLAPEGIHRANPEKVQRMCSELVSISLRDADRNAQDIHERIVAKVEKEILRQVLADCKGTNTRAAIRLGISRSTLQKKIVDYDLR